LRDPASRTEEKTNEKGRKAKTKTASILAKNGLEMS
jgi:hypothetical protein